MANAGTVNVNLVVDHSAFTAGMERGAQAVERLQGSVETAKHALELFGVALGMKEIIEFGKSTLESIDQQGKLADRLGITTQALGGLQYAAQMSGVATDTLNSGLTKMEKAISTAADSGGTAAKALAQLGIPIAAIIGLSPDQQFKKIADAIDNLHSSGDRTRIMMELFGKAGAELLPIMEKGSTGIGDYEQEAVKFGDALDGIQTAKAELAIESINKAKAIFEGIANTIVIAVAPAITGIVEKLSEFVTQSGNWRQAVLGAVENVALGFAKLGTVWDGLKAIWYLFQTVVQEGFGYLMTALNGAYIGFSVFAQVGQNLATAISTSLAAVGTALVLGVDFWRMTFYKFVQNVSEKFAELLDTLSKVTRRLSESAADAMDAAAGRIRASLGTISASATVAFDKAGKAADASATECSAAWTGMFSNLDTTGSTRLRSLSDAFAVAGANSAVKFHQAWDDATGGSTQGKIISFFDTINKAVEHNAEVIDAAHQKKLKIDQQEQQELAILSASKMAAINQDLKNLDVGINHALLVENQAYDARKKALDEWHKETLDSDAQYKLLLENATEQHNININNIESKAAKANLLLWTSGLQGQLQVTDQILGTLSGLMNSKNREMFEVGKAAAYAHTIVNTAQAAMGAYAAMSAIPYVGPALGAAAAAAAIAAGAVQLATISGTSFGGGGGISAGGGGSAISAAGGGAPGGAGAFGTSQAAPQSPTITISGLSDGTLYSGAAIRNLIDQLNSAGLDGGGLQTLQVA